MPASMDGLQPKRPDSADSEVASMKGGLMGQEAPASKTTTRPLFTPPGRPARKKRPKKPLLIGLAVLLLAAGGTYAFINRPATPAAAPAEEPAEEAKPAAEPTPTLDVSHTFIKLSGSVPQGLDVDPATGYVYAASGGSVVSGCKAPTDTAGANTLSAVDPAQNKELFNVATESAPVWPQVDGGRKVVYVAGSGNGIVGIHNLANGQKVSTINVKGKPQAFGFNAGTLIASNTADNTQTYYSLINPDTRQVVANYKVPEQPHGVVFDANAKVFYVLGAKTGDIAVVDAVNGLVKETFSATGPGASNSQLMAFSPKLGRLYVADSRSTSQVTVYDLAAKKVIGKIRFTAKANAAWGMQVDDDKGLLYVALPTANVVAVADASTLKPLGLIKVDACPYAVRLDTARGLGFTTGQTKATLSTFKLADVLKALKR